MHFNKKNTTNLRLLLIPFGLTLVLLLLVWLGYRAVSSGNKNKKGNDELAFLSGSNSGNFPAATPVFTPASEFKVPSAEIDTDQDGLSDALEILYKTDPNNADTDSDGYKDGSEVANGYDPVIPSPNDKIGASSTPAPTPSLTQQFVNQTGIETVTNNEEQINKFINETNARGILPVILDSDLSTTTETGKAVIVKYLDTLSVKKNTALKEVTPEKITAAFKTLTEEKNSATLDKIIADLKTNADIFSKVTVPKEAVELHKKYLAATYALRDNTEKLKSYQTDYIGVLTAASRLEGLRTIFTEVGEEIKKLEEKYGIK